MRYFEIFPEAFPEIGDVVGAPFPEGRIVVEMQVFFLRQPLGIASEIAIVQEAGGGLPEEFGCGYRGVGHGG